MKKYLCLQPVDNGKRHEAGETITLSEEHAAQLLTIKSIAPVADEAKAEKPGTDKKK